MSNRQTIGNISVLLPNGTADIAAKALAPRLATLEGARIGILDNCKEFADLVLNGVADVLRRDYKPREVRFWRKRYLGIPAPFTADMAAGCDAVINGVGH
jgi:hypothetical protein